MTERTMEHPDPIPQPAILTQPAVLHHIAQMVASDVTCPNCGTRLNPVDANKVASVIAAYHTIHEGDPLGTVRRDPETGAVALRVEDRGFHLWRVSAPNGEQYNNTEPTLPWPILPLPAAPPAMSGGVAGET